MFEYVFVGYEEFVLKLLIRIFKSDKTGKIRIECAKRIEKIAKILDEKESEKDEKSVKNKNKKIKIKK